jgi:tetratricopeptide (TPR) repeat protein
MDDVFAIQDEVTLAIVDKLKLDLLSDERPKIVKRYTENIDAYNLYLMGRYHWNRRTGDGLRKGLDHFQQAIEKDSAFALAYAGVADSYNLLGYYYYMPSKEALPKAKIAAERALEIDESLAEAHTSLAWVSMLYDWDWKAAEKEYKRAIELNPNYATAHHWYSFYLMIMGRRDKSLDEARRAVTLDPLSLQINNHLASMLHLAGQDTQAVEDFKRVIEMNPSYVLAHNELGHTYVELKMYDKALAEYQKVIELLGTRSPSIIADLGYLYAVTGKTDEAKKLLEELQSSSFWFAAIHLGLGQMDQAYEWLEKAYEERDHSMIIFKIVSYFEDFRSMPRFKALLQKVGFDI